MGDGIILTVIKLIKHEENTYKNFCLFVASIWKRVVKISKDKRDSIIIPGMGIILIKNPLGVVSAVHILFNNSIVFNNLHKFIFKFRTNATSTIIC